MSEIIIERVRDGDLAEILRNFERFWGDADFPRHLHHPMFVLEFGDTALVARPPGGDIAGYLFGFIAPTADAYIHLVAVRDDVRERGLGRALYECFERLAIDRGAVALKAITGPANQASQAFHQSMGFTEITRHDDYAGSGRPRVVMRKTLSAGWSNPLR